MATLTARLSKNGGPVPARIDPFAVRHVALNELPVGAFGRVHALQGDPGVCARLRELGFCESAAIEKIAGQGTVICQLCGARIALGGRAAAHVLVEFIA